MLNHKTTCDCNRCKSHDSNHTIITAVSFGIYSVNENDVCVWQMQGE